MKLLTTLLATAAVAGCASSATPNYDMRFGQAVQRARVAQTINPAAASTDPASGLDGSAAREVAGRYQDSFRKPPPTVNVINIGGSISSNQGGGSGR